MYNKKVNRESFSEATINAVWNKAGIVVGRNPNIIRKDACGAWIKRQDYGNTNSECGWEIDHIKPVSKGGTDDLWNLQPLQWKNNRAKSNLAPNEWSCAISAA